jgi:hypothetical protein
VPVWRCPLFGEDRKWLAQVKTALLTQSGRGSTNIPATTLSFNMVASIRGTVAFKDNRPRDEAIKKPEAADRGAYIGW